jgi:hypothetical protein
MVLIVYWRAWTPITGARRAFAWDSQWQYWGDLQFQVDSIRAGEWPLWNPFDRLGHPFHADPQPGTWYPLQWILIAAGVALKATPWWLISIKNLFHLWLLPAGMYAVCRHKKYSRFAAYLAGIVALMSQPFMWLAPSALNWSFAWMPWWLLATMRWIERPGFGRSAWMGVAFAMAALAGAWASVWYGILAVVPIAAVHAVRFLRELPTTDRRRHLRACATSLVAALAMIALLAGPQILDTLSIVNHTVRNQRDLDFVGTSVFGAVDIVGLFLPRGQGQVTYLGWIPLLVAGLWIVRRPSLENITLVAVAAISILLAFGSSAPVLPAAASLVPAFDLFRRAHRYAYVAVIPFSLLVAGGANAALAASVEASSRTWWLTWIRRCSVGAVLLGGFAFAIKATDAWAPNTVRDSFGYLAVAAVVGGGSLYLLLRQRAGRSAKAAVAALVCFELWFSSHQSVEAAFGSIPVPTLDGVAAFDGLPETYRVYDNGLLGFHPGIRLQIRDAGGYEDHPLALQRYARVMNSVHHDSSALTMLGVAYVFERAQSPVINDAMKRQSTSIGSGQWLIPTPTATVSWHDVATIADDDDAAWQQALSNRQIVTVEKSQWSTTEISTLVKADSLSQPVTQGVVTDFHRNQLRAAIFAPSAGLVMINEMVSVGWRAWDNGVEVPVHAVNGYARGVLVAAGPHSILMSYDPPRFVVAIVTTALGWLIVLLLLALTIRRRVPAAT